MTHLFIIVFFLLPLYVNSAGAEVISLSLGEQQSLPISSGTKFSVGNPDVIQVKAANLPGNKATLIIKAKSQGYSDLLLLQDNGQQHSLSYRVTTKKQGLYLRDAQSALQSGTGLEVLPQGDSFIVRGEAKKLADHNLLQAFNVGSKGTGQNLTQLDPMVRIEAELKILKSLKRANLGHIKVRGTDSQIWLEGIAHTKIEKERAEILAKSIFQNVQSNIVLPIDEKGVLRFKVQILELIRMNQSGSGLSWTDSLPGIIQLHQKLLKGAVSIDASLNMLARRGLAKILSQPEIAVNSEGIAELKVGGEIPISFKTHSFSSVQWKAYGLMLHLEVPGTGSNIARTNINVEITTLDHANGIEGVPATKVNRLQTTVDLSLGRTIFLSGLLQDNFSETVKSFPVLGDIPILGALFRSKDFQSQKSELVIAVTANRESM